VDAASTDSTVGLRLSRPIRAGANNHFIADASVMPGVSRTNSRTIMIAELVRGRAMPEMAR
jgi:hypothetical protein